ncbi:MAG: hypothetical protein RIE56_10595, partial [Amphiplicatus sp.]
RRMIVIVCGAMFIGAIPATADDSSDLSSLRNDRDRLSRQYDELAGKVSGFLSLSRELRSKDDEEMKMLIDGICRQDIEVSDDDADDIANSLVFDAVSEVSQSFGVMERDGDNLLDKLETLMNDLKSTRDRYGSLRNSSEVGSDASSALDAISRLIDDSSRRYDELQSDYKTLSNLKEGVMKGTNNPKIRAALEYGKQQHKDMQWRLGCDHSEVSVSGGRADCVKFDSSYGCVVIEIKPSTYDESKAMDQARRYIDGLKTMFKDDSKAQQYCKKDSSGNWEFTARVESYTACRS